MQPEQSWYVGVNGQQQGPLFTSQIFQMLQARTMPDTAYVFTQGMATWTPIRQVPQFAAAFGGPPMMPPPMPTGPAPSDVIDYKINGEELQYIEITLDPGEACVSESGAMLYVENDVVMKQLFGDGTDREQGALDVAMSAGKRLLTGESLTMTEFKNTHATERRTVAFASPYPGKIVAMDLKQLGGELICQKDSFLVAAKGTRVDIEFQKKILVGLFGGEGFILQKLVGDGMAFVHAGGCIFPRTLAAGETIRVDTGCLVAFQRSVSYDVKMVEGVGNMFLGGEGLFLAHLSGPGTVWLQSLPFSRLAGRVWAAAPQAGGQHSDEGSVLGGVGNLAMGAGAPSMPTMTVGGVLGAVMGGGGGGGAASQRSGMDPTAIIGSVLRNLK
jgi:uncharacterized protein (TIGR00266 family)